MKNRTIITTSWDDGHILDLRLADLLKKYNIQGTFYISPRSHEFDKTELLSTEDIKSLSDNFEIGAHTLTQVNLVKTNSATAKDEIIQSKKYLENIIQKEITSFCYPYGAYNNQVKQIVKDSGFLLARTTKRFVFLPASDPFELPTTVQVFTHPRDIINISLLRSAKTIAWDKISTIAFDSIIKTGGVFHLWGHSWEIEKNNQWQKLENLFDYISNREDIMYVSNSNIL